VSYQKPVYFPRKLIVFKFNSWLTFERLSHFYRDNHYCRWSVSLVPTFHRPSLHPCLPQPPSLFPLLPTVDIIRGFAHAASVAAARRCLQFLVGQFIRSTQNALLLYVIVKSCRNNCCYYAHRRCEEYWDQRVWMSVCPLTYLKNFKKFSLHVNLWLGVSHSGLSQTVGHT